MSAIPNFADDATLLPTIVQDADTGQVLMLAYMNVEAWRKTLETGEATYFSRSRNRIWRKGETSGHVQRVQEIFVDCDADTILLRVDQVGDAACHEGYESCFFRRFQHGGWEAVGRRIFDPREVYGFEAT